MPSLDIAVQAKPLNELKNDFSFTYIFIFYDIAIVKYMSDNLLVMNEGIIVEA